MEQKKKIILSIMFSFIISFSLLLFSNFYYYEIKSAFGEEKNFFSLSEKKEGKIFILGSSQLNAVNTTHINEILVNSDTNFEIYNLAKGTDRPSMRIDTIHLVISSKPELVVYGIGFRDLEKPYEISDQKSFVPKKPEKILPEPHTLIYDYFIDPNLEFIDFLQNPKLITIEYIRSLALKTSKSIEDPEGFTQYPNTPFYKIKNEETLKKTSEEIKAIALSDKFRGIDEKDGKDIRSLKKIIYELQKNDINITLFTTPYHDTFYEGLTDKDHQDFESILKDLESEFKIKIYRLHYKYSGLAIWHDHEHLVVDEDSLIFSNDLSQLILKEIFS